VTGRIEFYAGTWSHYTNHLAPIWKALPEDIRGSFAVIRGSSADNRARELGIPTVPFRQYSRDVLVCVASYEDYRAAKPAPVIFVNHGVGQTYNGDEKTAGMGSHSGGKGRERVVAFLCTSQRDAQNNRASYPDTPAYPVGVPYLDIFVSLQKGKLRESHVEDNFNYDSPTVTFSFHANIQACPETQWAVDWAKPAIRALVDPNNLEHNFQLLAHSHPRARKQLELFWKKMGVPYEPEWLKVLGKTDVYVIDNSSSGYEAAALGIPTVWWNPPFYRRDVHHGLRFWEAIPGVEVNAPMDLASAIDLALLDPPELQQKRDAAVSIAYGDADGRSLVDGHATERAVEACLLTLASLTSPVRS
jgi:hypothetical protein